MLTVSVQQNTFGIRGRSVVGSNIILLLCKYLLFMFVCATIAAVMYLLPKHPRRWHRASSSATQGSA